MKKSLVCALALILASCEEASQSAEEASSSAVGAGVAAELVDNVLQSCTNPITETQTTISSSRKVYERIAQNGIVECQRAVEDLERSGVDQSVVKACSGLARRAEDALLFNQQNSATMESRAGWDARVRSVKSAMEACEKAVILEYRPDYLNSPEGRARFGNAANASSKPARVSSQELEQLEALADATAADTVEAGLDNSMAHEMCATGEFDRDSKTCAAVVQAGSACDFYANKFREYHKILDIVIEQAGGETDFDKTVRQTNAVRQVVREQEALLPIRDEAKCEQVGKRSISRIEAAIKKPL